MMLQMRFRAKLYRQHNILFPLELSYKSPVRCSPYTEGCAGGFSYWTARAAQEIGVPEADCDKNVEAGSLSETCDWSCFKDNSTLFYASDYWHVGGFSHGSSEQSIMQEIYDNGPVELSFSTSSVPEFVVRSGTSKDDDVDTMMVIHNDQTEQELYSLNPKINKWWFATHAILAVGWGVEHTSWGSVRYWIVRNSWGRSWGENGYARMRRGNNDGGIETDSAMVIPDMNRLPLGFLEKAKRYHEDHAADWASTASTVQSQWTADRNEKADTVNGESTTAAVSQAYVQWLGKCFHLHVERNAVCTVLCVF